MNIQEFRQKYPQYNSVDDETLAGKVYEKYYNNVDRDQFTQSFLGQPEIRKPSQMPSTPPMSAPQEKTGLRVLDNMDARETPSMESIVQNRGLPGFINTQRATENAPADIGQVGKDFVSLVKDFPEVVKGVSAVAKGMYNTATTGEVDPLIAKIGEAAVEKYGSIDKFKEAFETEPAQTTMLVGGAAGLLGTATKAVGKVSKIPALAELGDAGITAGTATDIPMQMLKAGATVAKPAAKKIMESVAKFGTTINKAERGELLDTMFKYDILPNQGGVDKAFNMIEESGNEVSGLIDRATASGYRIPKQDVFAPMKETLKRAWDEGDMPPQNRKQVQNVINQWEERLAGVDSITPQQAQNFKQGIYKAVTYSRKTNQRKPMFSEIAKKDLARSFKEALEDTPGLENLKFINADEGELLALVEPLMKSANRIGNRETFGMGHFLGGSAAGGLTSILSGSGEAGTVAFFLGAIASDPRLQARFARLLNKAAVKAEKAQTGGAIGVGGQQASRSQQLVEDMP